jgi:hypothetical protein
MRFYLIDILLAPTNSLSQSIDNASLNILITKILLSLILFSVRIYLIWIFNTIIFLLYRDCLKNGSDLFIIKKDLFIRRDHQSIMKAQDHLIKYAQ